MGMDFFEKVEDTFETTLAERTYQEVCGTVEAVRGWRAMEGGA